MRVVLHILILAVFLSGYKAAAHAFEPVSGSQQQVQVMSTGEDSTTQDTASGCCDMACHHCCAELAGVPPFVAFSLAQYSDVPESGQSQTADGDYTFSLLRPPRNLV